MLAGAVALFLALVAGSAHADGLFLPEAPQDAPAMPATSSGLSAQPRGSDRQGAWERHVRIARHFLDDARDDAQRGEAGRLLLNVRPGASLDVVVERTVRIERGYTLSGRIKGDAVGFVTLVAHDEAVAASIWTPHAAYELSYLGGGVHALRDVTNAPPFECGGALPAESPMAEATAQQRATDDGSVVDILVLWTPAAEELYRGEPQVLSRIDMSIAYANDALERSGAFVSLRLVGSAKVDYQELDGFVEDLSRLRDPDDGHMDGVHDQRDALGADLVYLLTTHGGGVAPYLSPFAVGAWGHVFAHEVGHQFGIGHERLEDFLIHGVRSYRHGFTTEGCHASIVSYGQECFGYAGRQLPFYASPWRYSTRDGRALGVSRFSKNRAARGPADAVLTLNRNRHRVANYRPSRNGK